MSDDLVTVSIEGGVADVRLNRPDKYNALSPEMFRAIVDTGERLSKAKEVRAVVLSGNGRGFCAGLDMESMAGLSGGGGQGGTLLERDERSGHLHHRQRRVMHR